MSGGHFDYDDSRLYEWSRQVRIDGNPLLADLLHDIGDLLHAYDWWKSGDSSRDDWLVAWEFWKKKWMDGNIADLTMDSIRDSMRQMIWESLGKPKDDEYDRIQKKLSGW